MGNTQSQVRICLYGLLIVVAYTGCTTLFPLSPDPPGSSTATVPTACPQPTIVDARSLAKTNNDKALQSLKRQLHDRKRRIVELQTQLDALKVIDQSTAKSKSFNVP